MADWLSEEKIEFWDAGVTDTGREEDTAGDIQDSFHKRHARQTLELDTQGRVKAVRLDISNIYRYLNIKYVLLLRPSVLVSCELILVTIFRSITTIKWGAVSTGQVEPVALSPDPCLW